MEITVLGHVVSLVLQYVEHLIVLHPVQWLVLLIAAIRAQEMPVG